MPRSRMIEDLTLALLIRGGYEVRGRRVLFVFA
jgi:hypothetical protein